MNPAFAELKNIIDSSDSLDMKYDCYFVSDLRDATKSIYIWTVHVFGKGTFENKELIKKAKFTWDKDTKHWIQPIRAKDVPCEELIKQKNKEIEYYHDMGLTYPYCKPKCMNKSCNQEVSSFSETGLCHYCNHKEMCKGGLKCNGWMSVKCKYNELTVIGDTVCQGCKKDSSDWAERGRKINGSGGWFANDWS